MKTLFSTRKVIFAVALALASGFAVQSTCLAGSAGAHQTVKAAPTAPFPNGWCVDSSYRLWFNGSQVPGPVAGHDIFVQVSNGIQEVIVYDRTNQTGYTRTGMTAAAPQGTGWTALSAADDENDVIESDD